MTRTAGGFVMDRALQRALLERMRAVYPNLLEFPPISTEREDPTVVGNATYLAGHLLCDTRLSKNDGGPLKLTGTRITSAGLDFLEGDGGLTAILGVVTVRLHADTIRDMLAAKVDASDLPAEKKSAAKAALAKLSGTALQAAATDLVKMGLEHAPGVIGWLAHLVGT